MEGSTPTPPQPPIPPQTPMPPMGPQGGGFMQQPPEKASGMAIAALVVSIAGVFLCCFIVPSIVGLILGIIEKGRIKKGEASRKGSGMATAAIIISIVVLALSVISWIVYVILIATSSNSTFYYNY